MTESAATAKALIRRKGAARSRELVEAGVARSQLSRLVATGELVRLSRGIYTLPGAVTQDADEGVLIVAERIPEARLCLLTALRLHGLTTQAPFEVWIAIENKRRAPRLDWPRCVSFASPGEALDAGLEIRRIGGKHVRVTSVAKTVADCFKFRSMVGLDVAIEAPRDTLRARPRWTSCGSTRASAASPNSCARTWRRWHDRAASCAVTALLHRSLIPSSRKSAVLSSASMRRQTAAAHSTREARVTSGQGRFVIQTGPEASAHSIASRLGRRFAHGR